MTSTTHKRAVDQTKLQHFQMKVLQDIAAAGGLACAYVGDRCGLYKTMAEAGPITSQELAKATGTNERYVREWLINQAAGGYVEYDPQSKRYALPLEHALVLADEDSEFFAAGGFQTFLAFMHAAPRMVENFRSGKGLGWGEQHSDLFEGTRRFFKPAYVGCLLQEWIPSIKGLQEKLQRGITVADVGCGHGVSTMVMAKAFPNSKFYGFDTHLPSVEKAQKDADQAGLKGRVSFHQSVAHEIPDHGYGLISYFDCLHDMGDPISACKRAKQVLKEDGCLLIVEPMAGNTVEENFNDVGRAFTSASVLCCTPNAIACGGPALGTVATDEALSAVVKDAGFRTFRRACQTPFNRIFEARV
jgi:SAM-dependent methyltransferase